jgi:Icc-related predicted phosphoesterase
MRIVAVADTHTFHEDLRTIPDGDVFVHAGDLCRGGRLDELRIVAEWVRRQPHRHKIVVAGNHDWCFVREPQAALEILGQEIIYLQDAEVVLDGVRFWGSPWQPEYNEWAFNLPRGEALASKWALIPTGIHVLVTHGPPASIGDRGGHPERRGCADLLTAVQRLRPLLHLFGHIHQDGGFWRTDSTCFANVTCWECERGPTVIDVDAVSGQVAAVSIPPARKPRRQPPAPGSLK